jgi:hypothetical protein
MMMIMMTTISKALNNHQKFPNHHQLVTSGQHMQIN